MKKLISALVVSVVVGLGGAAVLGEGTGGCGTTVQGVFTDIETGCIAADLAASVVPPSVLPATVAQDIADVCDLAQAVIPDLETIVTAFMGKVSPALDAGTVALFAKAYQQPAWALPKIQAARARRLSAAH